MAIKPISIPLMSTYLENYLESISTLPSELNRNFALIGELDVKSQEIVDKIEICIEEYRNNGQSKFDDILTEEEIEKLRDELKEACLLGDEKVSLAAQTYEMVDKHIRRLDQDLKKFEHEIEMQRKQITQQLPSQSPLTSLGHGTKFNPVPQDNDTMTNQEKKNIQRPGRPRKFQDSFTKEIMPKSFEMPIDPNEPTYCICNRVSFGDMIGCDNPDCEIEWFHFECVGLNAPVKGKWYCDDCKEKMKKR